MKKIHRNGATIGTVVAVIGQLKYNTITNNSIISTQNKASLCMMISQFEF